MSNNQGQQPQQGQPDKGVVKQEQVAQTWVICRTPFTALLPSGARALSSAGSMPAHFGLRFERGLQLLAGHADLGGTGWPFITLEQLPEAVAALTEPERAKELQRLMGETRKQYPLCFTRDDVERNAPELLKGRTWPSANMATFIAIGTMKDLVRSHHQAVREGASLGSHRASLQAVLYHQDVPDDIKQLARTRLTAWNQGHAA